MAAEEVRFGEFRVDVRNERLWRGQEAMPLPPRVFALLCYLVERPNALVTKAELFATLWPKMVVEDAVLTVAMGELRKALGDDPRQPRFIETVHRRGYRFLAPVTTSLPPASSQERTDANVSSGATLPSPLATARTSRVIGRQAELAQLYGWLEKALGGERQLIFVTGEPGIGKTTVLEAFLEQVAARENMWIAQGQCIEHYGVGEAYLPVLDVLGQLGRQPDGERLVALLRRYAPTWLLQMPALITEAEGEALQRKVQGTIHERMLREIAEALEAFTVERPVLLVLEDLQWSDYSTTELLSFLARRRQPCRLLVLGTYRPVDVIMREHPLGRVKQELQVHQQCEELALAGLSRAAVEEYLTVRFSRDTLPALLVSRLHQRTDGNPLFMVNIVQDWLVQEVIGLQEGSWVLQGDITAVAEAVPQNVRQLINRQLERLGPQDQRMLEAASVVGVEFSAAAVAVGVGEAVEGVEEACEGLARREQLLQERGIEEWPDGTVAARYSFVHALYQEVLYERVTGGRRARLHQQIGTRLEAAHGEQVNEIAAKLAVHFEQGREYGRAVQYLGQAAKKAIQLSANLEAIALLTKGLKLAKTLPDTSERTRQELALHTTLGPALVVTKGYAERAYARALELCQQMGETPQHFSVTHGLWALHLVRAELQKARILGEQLLHTARSEQHPPYLLGAFYALGETLLHIGELLAARAYLEEGLILYDPQKGRSSAAFRATQNLGVACAANLAFVLWFLGYPNQALRQVQEALAQANELAHPYSRAFALYFAAIIHYVRREEQTAQRLAETTIALSTEQEFAIFLAGGNCVRGGALAAQGLGEKGIAQICQGLAIWQDTGAELGTPSYLAVLAEAYMKTGQVEEGMIVLDEALTAVDKTGERFYEAELYRLRGELLLIQEGKGAKPKGKSRRGSEAEEYFHKAIEIARQQEAKSLELRATMSLARLWQQQGKIVEARQMLAEIYGWFTEGFDTGDLTEAKALLTTLERKKVRRSPQKASSPFAPQK